MSERLKTSSGKWASRQASLELRLGGLSRMLDSVSSPGVVTTLVAVLSLFTLLLAVWAAVQLHKLPYSGVQWASNGIVTYLDARGPAGQSGMALGDRVMEVVDRDDLRLSLRSYTIGQQVELIVENEQGRRLIPIVLGAPTLATWFQRFEPILIGAIFWVVSLWMWLRRPRRQLNLVFLVLSQCVTVVCVAGYLSIFRYPLMELVFIGTLIILAPLALHFFSLISHWSTPRLARVVQILYLVSAGLILTLVVEYWVDTYSFTSLRTGYVAVVLFFAALVLMRRPAQSEMLARHRHHILVSSVLLSFLPPLLGTFVPQLILGSPLVSAPWTMVFLVCLPLGYAYGTQTDRLSRVDLQLNRVLIYGILALCFLGIYGAVFWAAETYWAGHPNIRFGLLALSTLVITFVFPPVYRTLRHTVDYFLYGGWYDYRSIVREMSHSLNQTHTLQELGDEVLALMQMMHFEAALLYWIRPGRGIAPQSYGFDEQQTNRLGDTAHRIAEEFRFKPLTASGLHALEDNAVIGELWWAPLIHNARLTAVLITRQNTSATPLAPDDMNILKLVTERAAITAENLALVDRLQEQLRALEEVRGQLNEAQRHQAQSRELERVSLARDLHDGPMQELYGIQYQLQAFVASLPGTQVNPSVQTLQSSLGDVTESLRELCWTLRPPTLSRFGLPLAIKSYIERFADQYPHLQVTMDLLRQESLTEAVRLSLFRVFQQAMTNAVRHADARTVDVRMWQDEGRLFLEVQDDGRGFEVPDRWISLGRRGHFGLLGTAERMNSLRGELHVESSPGNGTTLRVWVPVRDPSDENNQDSRNSWTLTLPETKRTPA